MFNKFIKSLGGAGLILAYFGSSSLLSMESVHTPKDRAGTDMLGEVAQYSEPEALSVEPDTLDQYPQASNTGVVDHKRQLITLEELDAIQQRTLILQAELEQRRVKKQIDDIGGKGGSNKGGSRAAGSYSYTVSTPTTQMPTTNSYTWRPAQYKVALIYGGGDSGLAARIVGEEGKLYDVRIGDTLSDGLVVSGIYPSHVELTSGTDHFKLIV